MELYNFVREANIKQINSKFTNDQNTSQSYDSINEYYAEKGMIN